MQEFFQILNYLLAANFLDDIAGDFNYDLVKQAENKISDNFTEISFHVQIVNKPTHIPGSLIDHVYIEKTLMEEFTTNEIVGNIYFSDHETGRIVVEKNVVDFCSIPLVIFSNF